MAVRFSVKDLKDLGRHYKIEPKKKFSKIPQKSKENRFNHKLFIDQAKKYLDIEVVPEYRFCKRQWRFDMAIPDKKIAIEVEGGIWVNGGHTRGSGFMLNMEKYNEAAILGWRLLRCPPDQLLSDKFFQLVKRALE
jgi:hypothetical protein